MSGMVQGHNVAGEAIIQNEFGTGTTRSFDEIRLVDPFNRRLPNWCSLPAQGKIVRPSPAVRDRLRALLGRQIPPGPSYMDLIEEIWGRGFEVFLVGGTVRDAIANEESHDIDLVTTMPLKRITQFTKSMYRTQAKSLTRKWLRQVSVRRACGSTA